MATAPSSDSKAKALQEMNELKQSLPVWATYDRVLTALLDGVIQRMETANKAILEKAEAALADADKSQGIKTVLARALEEGFRTNESEVAGNLKALLGIVHYNVLLQNRLKVFREIHQLTAGIIGEPLAASRAKELLRTYGPTLQHVWKISLGLCASLDERRMIVEAVKPKPAQKAA